jgi:hypothetical protein
MSKKNKYTNVSNIKMSTILEYYRKQTDYSYTSIGQTSYSTEINRYIDDLIGIIKLTGNPNATIDSYTILMLWSSPENKNKYTKIPVDITGIYSEENITISDKFIKILIKYPGVIGYMNTERKFDLVKRGILNIREYPMILNDMNIEMKYELVKKGILNIREYPMILNDMNIKMKFDLVKRGIIDLYTKLSLHEKIDYFYKNKEPLYKLFGHNSTDYESMTTHDLTRLRFDKYDYVPEGAPERGRTALRAPQGQSSPDRVPRPDSIKSFRLFLLKRGIISRFFDSLDCIDPDVLILAIFECSPINKITFIDYVLGLKKVPKRPLNIIDSHFNEKNATAIIHLLSNGYYIPVLSKGSQKMVDFFDNRQVVSFIIEKSGLDLCSDISRIIVDYICGPKGPSGIKRPKGPTNQYVV